MKRKLSLVLAMVMMLSLVPMSAFAASDNGISGVLKVKDDANLAVLGAPELKIENDGLDWGNTETFVLKLENADWLDTGDTGITGNFATAMKTKIDASVSGAVYSTVVRESAERVKVTIQHAVGGVAQSTGNIGKIEIRVPMLVEMDGEVGKVTIESKSGKLTEETLIFAQGSNGATTVSRDGTVTFNALKTIKPIRIEETSIGSIDVAKAGDKYIKLSLDKNFQFVDNGNTKISGDLVADGTVTGTTVAKFDKENLTIYIHGGKGSKGFALNTASHTGDIVISGLEVKPTKDAKEGKVNVTVSSDLSEIKTTKLEVGEYADYKVNVTADGEATEVISGRYEVADSAIVVNGGIAKDANLTVDEKHELQTLVIEEKVEGSWTNGKSVLVEFPSWVKIIGVDKAGTNGSDIISETFDGNEYEFQMDANAAGKKKVELTFYVSVEAGKSGDIEAVVGGKALDKEVTVVLGKAVAPVKVEAVVAPIKAGVRDQEIGKITITENVDGALLEGEEIVIELDDDMEWDKAPNVEVTKGDLEIDEDDIDVKDNVLTIRVTDASTEPSTLEITKGRVKVDRAIAEGKITVEVKGSALIQNGYDKDDARLTGVKKADLLDEFGFFGNAYYASVEVANVITPADNNTKGDAVKFVIDSKTMKVGNAETQMDVAPYIKDGRTMLPIRYVAQALNVSESNIIWNDASRTVTVFKGSSIVTITIGSNVMNVNGTPVHMDTVAEIKDGRTMLPLSFLGAALGAEVTWDGATRTVTVK